MFLSKYLFVISPLVSSLCINVNRVEVKLSSTVLLPHPPSRRLLLALMKHYDETELKRFKKEYVLVTGKPASGGKLLLQFGKFFLIFCSFSGGKAVDVKTGNLI